MVSFRWSVARHRLSSLRAANQAIANYDGGVIVTVKYNGRLISASHKDERMVYTTSGPPYSHHGKYIHILLTRIWRNDQWYIFRFWGYSISYLYLACSRGLYFQCPLGPATERNPTNSPSPSYAQGWNLNHWDKYIFRITIVSKVLRNSMKTVPCQHKQWG